MASNEAGADFPWVGRAIKRLEDPRLITGRGQFIEDLRIPEMCDVVLLRSIHAHARIASIRTEAAKALPGVIGIFTAADLAGIGGVPAASNLNSPLHPPLSGEIVRFVGDPIVALVAENRVIGADALELVEVDYEPRPAVIDAAEAARDEIVVHAELGTNVAMTARLETGDVGPPSPLPMTG